MRRGSVGLIVAAAALLAGGPAAAQRAGDPEAGRRLAEAWCSDCHVVGPGASGPDTDLGLALIRDGHGPRALDTLLRYRGSVHAELFRTLAALKAL